MFSPSWLIGIVRSKVGCPKGTGTQWGLWIVGLMAAGVLALPSGAWAATCTDNWKGPAEGSWNTAANWSLGTVPTSSDVVCIGPKTTVESFEANTAGTLQVEGTLLLTGGTLEVSNASEASSVATLTLTGGVLTGAGSVDVSGSLFVGSGEMSGSGSTVVMPGASATIGTGETFLNLNGRTLANEGTTTLDKGHITESEGAEIINSGTFLTNTEGGAFRNGGGGGSIINTGLLERITTSGIAEIGVYVENLGTINANKGIFRFTRGNATWSSGSTLEGTIEVLGLEVAEDVTAGSFMGENATIVVAGTGVIAVVEKNSVTVAYFRLEGGLLEGTGTVNVSHTFTANGGLMQGSGALVVLHGATGLIGASGGNVFGITEHQLINEGVITFSNGHINMEKDAVIININTFKADSEVALTSDSIGVVAGEPHIQNYGLFEKSAGFGITTIVPKTESLGAVVAYTGQLEFKNPVRMLTPAQFAERSRSAPRMPRSNCGDPVNCSTGNFYETQTDLAVGGRGVGLGLTRTYNSQAGAEGSTGTFGHGWSSSFSDHVVAEEGGKVTVYHGDGSAVPFTEVKAGTYLAPAWTQDTLSGTSTAGYSLVLADQVKYQFEGSTGRLQSVSDRNGNQTTMGYNKAGQLETITDPAGRKITLAYNGEGLVESAKDPMGHTAKYTYEGGNLASVTLPGEAKARWQYHYDGSHEMTSMIDGRSGETVNEYNGSHQVTSQTDPAGRKLKFEYEAFHTKITNNGTGSVTDEWSNSDGEPTQITRGFGTGSASTETFSYDAAGDLVSRTDGNGHTTSYTYENGNMTSLVDPNKGETKWTYNGTHDVLSMTDPNGETTTVTRDAHGNAEAVSRPAPGKSTQTTTYHYNANGQLTSMVDPLKHTWSYEYNGQGDRTAVIDPEGGKRTFGYNEDSYKTSTVSPLGNAKGAEASQYTTKIERDAQNRATTVTDPLGHTVKYVYDGDGNLETLTDSEGHPTTNTYNGDNQPTKVKEPNGGVTETEYDGAGRVTAQIDGNKHKTTYVRNILGEITEVKDPLGRVKTMEYDATGNLIAITDAAKRTVKYAFDPANRLKEVVYSDGKTPTVKYECDADGNRTKMIDGTGTTTYVYDLLGRLVQSTNGHGDTVGYEYDLASEQTKLTYPGGNMLTRAYDSLGRMQSVTDWAKNTTTFGYDPNSNLKTTTFPKATGDQDKVSFNRADQVMKITMTGSGLKALASLAYTRDSNGQIKSTTATGLPGTESVSDTYDANNRIEKSGSTAYGYDSADNPTTLGSSTSSYDAGNQLKASGATVYGYDQLGERVSASPQGGQTTSYAYDQAGDLLQVKQGKVNGLNDLYTYNGDGLRSAQIKGKAVSHLTWDTHGGLPLIVADEQNTYIYGPTGVPIEAVQSKGAVLYFHHDQQGSTRVLTGASGAVEATSSYDPYGNSTGATGTVTTPFGYDGQYANADTGLIYLRARAYDPATAQFLSVDPIVQVTQTPYTYGLDNPLTFYDPSGLFLGIPGTPSTGEVLSTVTSAIGSHAGTVIEGIGVGAACIGAPEFCIPAGLAAADLSVNSADVHAALHPSEAASLPSNVLQSLAAAGVSALPTWPITEGVYEAYFNSGAGSWAYRQLVGARHRQRDRRLIPRRRPRWRTRGRSRRWRRGRMAWWRLRRRAGRRKPRRNPGRSVRMRSSRLIERRRAQAAGGRSLWERLRAVIRSTSSPRTSPPQPSWR